MIVLLLLALLYFLLCFSKLSAGKRDIQCFYFARNAVVVFSKQFDIARFPCIVCGS